MCLNVIHLYFEWIDQLLFDAITNNNSKKMESNDMLKLEGKPSEMNPKLNNYHFHWSDII